MRWFWPLIYGYLVIEYVVNFVGFLFDDWRLDTFDIAFACFVVVLWAAEQIVRREIKYWEGE